MFTNARCISFLSCSSCFILEFVAILLGIGVDDVDDEEAPFEVIDLREVIEGVDCDRFVKPSRGEDFNNVDVGSKCR